jgi:hypothetical protein
MGLFRKNKVDSIKKLILTKNGHRWYEYTRPTQLPIRRALSAEIAAKQAKMNITRETLIESIDKMVGYANKGNIVDLFTLLTEIQRRMTFCCEEATMVELASVYFLLDDENPELVEDFYKRKKLEIWKNDSELKYFFLQSLLKLTQNFTTSLAFDIREYLEENIKELEKLENLLQK